MNRALYIGLILVNLVLVLLIANRAIVKKQAIVVDGRRVVMELAPVDPRSLMQGDYMVLSYALSRNDDFRRTAHGSSTRGQVVLTIGEGDEGRFARLRKGETLSENEVFLNYRRWRRGFRFGIESFFFEEGMAERYENAKFAELRVGPDGDAVIVDLLGAKMASLSK